MSDWETVDSKKSNRKCVQNTIVYSDGNYPSEKEIAETFEENYDEIIENGMFHILNDIKPHSHLLNNVNSATLTDFFYSYINKERTLNIEKNENEDKNQYYSDEDFE
tara:strand:- start:17 stop:337 length:321 start_codon:yes stop_codon:yes gene_type:complete